MDDRMLENQMFLIFEFLHYHLDNFDISFYDLLRILDLVAGKDHFKFKYIWGRKVYIIKKDLSVKIKVSILDEDRENCCQRNVHKANIRKNQWFNGYDIKLFSDCYFDIIHVKRNKNVAFVTNQVRS